MLRPAVFCGPPVRPAVQPAGPPCCAARRYVFLCSPPARPVVQSALLCSPPCAARFLVQPSGALCCAVRLLVQPSVALFRAARPLVQPVGSLSCAGRPNVQLAGPLVLARPLVQPAKNSCFSIGNTALQPARPAGSPFSVIQKTLKNTKMINTWKLSKATKNIERHKISKTWKNKKKQKILMGREREVGESPRYPCPNTPKTRAMLRLALSYYYSLVWPQQFLLNFPFKIVWLSYIVRKISASNFLNCNSETL